MTFCFKGTSSSFIYPVRCGICKHYLFQILLVRIKYSANDADCVTRVIIPDVYDILSCFCLCYDEVIGILKNNTYSYVQILWVLIFETVSVGNRILTFRGNLVRSSWREDMSLADEDTKLGYLSTHWRSVTFLKTVPFFTAYLHQSRNT